jgi:hypothetical protein
LHSGHVAGISGPQITLVLEKVVIAVMQGIQNPVKMSTMLFWRMGLV